MEEDKAAAYYEELTRKGEGAARFKHGLGFSSKSSDTSHPSKSSAHPSSTSSFLSSFVKASSPSKSTEVLQQKQMELENVQNKLKKKKNENSESLSRVSEKRSSSIERNGDPRRRSRSRERSRNIDRERKSERRRRGSRSRSWSSEDDERRRRRSGRENRSRRRSRSLSPGNRRPEKDDRENRNRRRSRSSSPGSRRLEKGRDDRRDSRTEGKKDKENNGAVDYGKLIKGYAEMTPAERVKAKMKLQLAQTVEKDATTGMRAGWERFDFNKDAPLDEGEEMEAAEDDANLVKKASQTFRFSAIESRREEQIKDAHDDAMFGVPTAEASTGLAELEHGEPIVEDTRKQSNESGLCADIISEKVLAKQIGSWRDRARKLKNG